MPDPAWNLDELRRQIDEIDDRIQDLLIQRAEVVGRIAALKSGVRVPAYRPGREAAILRRLMARHRGPLPRPIMVRIWREILSAHIGLQAKIAIAVFAPDTAPGCWDLARDHFGSHSAMTAYGTAQQVLRAVTDNQNTVGVLPMPAEGDADPWWPLLISNDDNTPRVIARLPFMARGNARGDGGDALAIGYGSPDATGADRCLVVIETRTEVSRTRLLSVLKAGGLAAAFCATAQPRPGVSANLVEFDSVVAPGDVRLRGALETLGGDVDGVFSLGGYARPLGAAEAGPQRRTQARRRGQVS